MAVRRFLVASSLARLIERQRGRHDEIVEGFFPPQADRRQTVRIETAAAYLTLVMGGEPSEERFDIPRRHAEALIAATGGLVGFGRTALTLPGGEAALLDRFTRPGRLDTITVAFVDEAAAAAFEAPPWFGPDITAQAPYEPGALGLQGIPDDSDVTPDNRAVEALLDVLEDPRNAAPAADGASDAVDVPLADAESAAELPSGGEPDGEPATEPADAAERAGLDEARDAARSTRVEVERSGERTGRGLSDLARLLPARRAG
ncbi:hypothetical protein [Salinarimonas soli]|uniref:Uncharacterized protein n=1 Tax=Salinarimonas soli TaxID=1638099 RepID=A0A5B2V7D7_9HYPH|nr:hypothetical protein [Salinarimonas soli]KAA2235423.1 hypothetical protein F0L46_19530 [Salinarimonas soli]